jgi:deazaflavin-dependent oxidoreductase (nitroreductase family)
MPSDFTFKALNLVHRAVLKASFGRIGSNAWNMPVLELTTIGRKTGEPRSVILTSPVQEGRTYVVVASKGGEDRNPAWLLNVRANPDVEVTIKGVKETMRARVADADERARLWPIVTRDHENYAGYQRKTDREIPLVLLEPRN